MPNQQFLSLQIYSSTEENSSKNNEMLWEKLIVQNKSVSNNDMPYLLGMLSLELIIVDNEITKKSSRHNYY